ncbi:MAG TPA: protein-methionine-sulfoxide reductase heme-binding subunit MsrQ [Pyrinomonadaceae bacterium]|jgi:sulfoxide reductase heme-binding subunit YedZ|nr:protein-methionine-sulfoxide reductase heme-binding subunit MsrQ [Pyrinomonadaceae bacterium]
MNEVRFYKIVITANALVPLFLMAIDLQRGRLGANPVEFFLRATGVMALIMLGATLAITPLRRLTHNNSLIKYRRLLGLFSFFYAFLHLITYTVFDRSGSLVSVIEDVKQRPFIALGMTAFLILVPLAITSTNGWIKRLGGKNWARLHRLTYAAALLGVIHFWMIVKSDIFYPLVFAVVIGSLLLFRLWLKFKPQAARQPH